MDKITLVIICISVWTTGEALRCYTCKSSKIASKSGLTSSFLRGLTGSVEEDSSCNEAGILDLGNIQTAECASNQVCGNVRASITVKEKITNSEVTIESVGRGCTSYGTSNYRPVLAIGGQCESSVDAVKGATNVLIDILNKLPLVGVEVDGEVCYCDTDQCTAGRCTDDSVKIAGYCFKIWLVGGVAGVLGIIILLVCCCCCCCCKKKPQQGIIIRQTFPQGVHQAGGPPYVRFDGENAQTFA